MAAENPVVKASFTVSIEMTEAQHAAYAAAYGVGFAGLEIVQRARQAIANVLDEAAWMRFAAFKVSKAASSPNWYDDWEVTGRDDDGNAILRHRPTSGLYHILPIDEG